MSRSLLVFLFFLISINSSFSANLKHDGYLVKYKNFPKSKKETALSHFKMEKVKNFPEEKNDNIEYIEPNYIYTINAVPEDPRYREQWAHQKIDSEKAWDIATGTKEVVVAVIDTGVDYTHEDLRDNAWVNQAELNGEVGVDDDGNGFVDDVYGYDFVNKDGDPMDDHNHGTHCSGILGAKHNNKGIAGVNSNVRIMAVKFLSSRGSGTLADAIESIKYATDNGAHILSNSWGGGGYSEAMKEAIEYSKSKGVLFVAAAGNSNSRDPHYPSGYNVDNVISVASSDERDFKSSFSNYGLPHVDIAAPGSNILSTVRSGYAIYSGTSMATPYVSGAAALMLSYEEMGYLELKDRIFKTSDYLSKWKRYVTTSGRLNVNNLLSNIEPPRPSKPRDGKWKNKNYSLESKHPYEDNKVHTYEINVPKNSKFIRLYFEKLDTEANYDIIEVSSDSDSFELSGKLEKEYSQYISVENSTKLKIKFTTDRSVSRWGFKIAKFQYQ
jgi:subtilisin family serine protease